MLKKYQKILSDAGNKSFKTNDGELKNLRELRKHLSTKGKDFFMAYVNGSENHFANWIENVFEDHELAFAFRDSKSFGRSLKILDDRIKYAELWLAFNKEKEELTQKLAQNIQCNYVPEHQVFETLFDYEKNRVSKNETSILKTDLKPLQPVINIPPSITKTPEPQEFQNQENTEHQRLLKELETKTGITLSTQEKKGFFARIFKRK